MAEEDVPARLALYKLKDWNKFINLWKVEPRAVPHRPPACRPNVDLQECVSTVHRLSAPVHRANFTHKWRLHSCPFSVVLHFSCASGVMQLSFSLIRSPRRIIKFWPLILSGRFPIYQNIEVRERHFVVARINQKWFIFLIKLRAFGPENVLAVVGGSRSRTLLVRRKPKPIESRNIENRNIVRNECTRQFGTFPDSQPKRFSARFSERILKREDLDSRPRNGRIAEKAGWYCDTADSVALRIGSRIRYLFRNLFSNRSEDLFRTPFNRETTNFRLASLWLRFVSRIYRILPCKTASSACAETGRLTLAAPPKTRPPVFLETKNYLQTTKFD